MGKRTVRAIIDDREPEDLIAAVATHDEVEDWRVERLEIGDVQFEDSDIVVERKTPADYNSSLMTGHLGSQCERMSQISGNSYVLVEGDIEELYEREYGEMPPEAVRGSMASLMVRKNVPIIPVADQGALVDLSVRLARKSIEDPTTSRLDSGTVSVGEPLTKRFFGLIKGIGPETADALYDEFDTVEKALSAEPERFQTIDGIGPKTADKIHKAFREDG